MTPYGDRMDLRLDRKAALVTGASRGIGLAIARRFAEAGAHGDALVAQARRPGRGGRRPGRPGRPGRLVRRQRRRPRAGRGVRGGHRRAVRRPRHPGQQRRHQPLLRADDRDRRAPGRTRRSRSTSSGCSPGPRPPTGPPLGRAPAGASSTSSSVGGLGTEPGIGWYNVTKAAVIHLTRQLAYELAPAVRVNAIAPGLVKTQFARVLWETRRGAGVGPASRSSGSASPTTSPPPPSSWSRTPRRGSPARCWWWTAGPWPPRAAG